MPYFGIPIRNGLPIGLGSVAGFGIAPFEPYSLFENGEQGAWYDPSDLSTLFTDSAGTTPVTAVEQFVGLMLDKSGRGNHATQTTSAKRPKLAARYNLLTYSEQFDNGAWAKSNATVAAPTAIVAPDGTLTTDKLVEGVGTSRKSINQTGAKSNQTFSLYAQKGERDFVAIGQTNTGGLWAVSLFNLNLGIYVNSYEAGGQPLPTNNTITSVGAGWYRISCTLTSDSMSAPVIMISNGGNPIFEGYTGDGTSGIYIWGADLRPASQATGLIGPTYQRVVDAATYDAVGFLPYLEFDGLSWSMGTGSINPGAVDKAQVFAGVRKLSDAEQGAVAEFSATIASNSGTFLLAAPDGATQTYGFDSKGTTQVDAVASSLAAPRTNVVTGLADIAGDSCVIRINGAVADTETGDQGTGNFLTYPLFIGGRNNASVFFNGWLSSLIVRFGANLSQSQIEATESWVNGKTGAF
jgi:hypothetical protein